MSKTQYLPFFNKPVIDCFFLVIENVEINIKYLPVFFFISGRYNKIHSRNLKTLDCWLLAGSELKVRIETSCKQPYQHHDENIGSL